MGDFKSKLPDLKEVVQIAGKLFNGLQKTVKEVYEDYKRDHGLDENMNEKGHEAKESRKEKSENIKSASNKPIHPESAKTQKSAPESGAQASKTKAETKPAQDIFEPDVQVEHEAPKVTPGKAQVKSPPEASIQDADEGKPHKKVNPNDPGVP